MNTLFESQAPRPLADRLRPQRLAEIVGQDHLLGPEGPIGRMVASRRLASMILWGPPGCGKTTIARLLARRHRPRLRAALGGVFRRRRSAQGVRGGEEAPREGARHAAVRRRDPPLQPRAAGRVSALCRGRHGDPGRRDDREPVFRAERGAVVARAGVRAAPARRRRRSKPCLRRAEAHLGHDSAADRRRPRRAARDGRRRRAVSAQPGRGDRPPAARARRSGRRSSPNWCSAARRSTTRARKATTT